MFKDKEKSAVGTDAPTAELEIRSDISINHTDGKIKMIEIENLLHHPDNPRKAIGDISELTDSIRKNGIMQNLTVIQSDKIGFFYVLIGNRRFEAAKRAGLEVLPCLIAEGLSKAEQVGIMLEENMQRNDLTVIEQAQGFQLMFDLGETVQTISQRTGFSETTVRRRLNIAQLDSDTLRKAHEEWQVSLDDLRELEKIKNVKKRNELLKRSHSSSVLKNFIINELREEKAKVCKAAIDKLMKSAGIPFDAEARHIIWEYNKVETIKKYDLTVDPPKKLSFKVEDGMIYTQSYQTIYVLRKKKKEKKELTEEEKKQRKIKSNCRHVFEITKEIIKAMRYYLEQLIKEKSSGLMGGGNFCSDRELRFAWDILMDIHGTAGLNDFVGIFMDKSYYQLTDDERETVRQKLKRVPVALQIAHVAVHALEISRSMIESYSGYYDASAAKGYVDLYNLLRGWGFRFPEDREQEFEDVLEGESELYTRKEKENGKHDINT